MSPLPTPWLLTCPARAASLGKTLASFAAGGWGETPRVCCDAAAERAGEAWGTAARARRLTAAWADMARAALAGAEGGDGWLLLLEDDLEFHPRLGSLLAAWEPLRDERCVLASLFNPSLRATAEWGEKPRAFAADPRTFLGAQALLLRRRVLPEVLAQWDTLPGLTSQRLARLLGDRGPIWVHRPSLIQHTAADSSWGARIQRALDFNPAWQP